MSEENIKNLLEAIDIWDHLFMTTVPQQFLGNMIGPERVEALLEARYKVNQAASVLKAERGIRSHEEP